MLKHPDKSDLRGGSFVLVYSFGLQAVVVGIRSSNSIHVQEVESAYLDAYA